ncbi:formate/nitrite transporter family protein [Shigella flexneri]
MPCSIAGAASAAGRYQHRYLVALAKTTAPATVLFFKGALCNCWFAWQSGWRCALKGRRNYCYLVVSAAFIASGYEHSIANMTLFALSSSATTAKPTRWRVLVITCCG